MMKLHPRGGCEGSLVYGFCRVFSMRCGEECGVSLLAAPTDKCSERGNDSSGVAVELSTKGNFLEKELRYEQPIYGLTATRDEELYFTTGIGRRRLIGRQLTIYWSVYCTPRHRGHTHLTYHPNSSRN